MITKILVRLVQTILMTIVVLVALPSMLLIFLLGTNTSNMTGVLNKWWEDTVDIYNALWTD